MFGYTNAELIGKNIKMLMPNKYATNHDEYLKAFRDGKSGKANITGRRLEGLSKAGVPFVISIAINVEKQGEQTVYVGSITRLSNECGIITINQKGIIKSCDKKFLQMFGYKKPKMLVGKNINMLMPEPYATYHDSYLAAMLDPEYTSRIVNNEMGRNVTGKHLDGGKFAMHLSIFQIVQDGETQYAGKVALISDDEVATSGEVKFVTDSKGHITFMDEMFVKMIGYTQEEMIGKNVKLLIPDSVAITHDEKIANYIKTRKSNMIGAGSRLVAVKSKSGDLLPVTATIEEEQIDKELTFHATLRFLDSLEAIITLDVKCWK